MKNILLVCIRFYRRFLSPLKIQPTCIYIPTCSEYAAQAIEKYGSLKVHIWLPKDYCVVILLPEAVLIRFPEGGFFVNECFFDTI